jgi:hypothetical protein
VYRIGVAIERRCQPRHVGDEALDVETLDLVHRRPLADLAQHMFTQDPRRKGAAHGRGT